jgi:hypothetical protein
MTLVLLIQIIMAYRVYNHIPLYPNTTDTNVADQIPIQTSLTTWLYPLTCLPYSPSFINSHCGSACIAITYLLDHVLLLIYHAIYCVQ